jgi:EpsI family protein
MRFKRDHIKYVLLIVILAVGSLLVYRPGRASTGAGTIDLSSFPMKLDEWTGTDISLSDTVLRTLGATDYLMRQYQNGDMNLTLYITYFDTGHGGLTHNPEKCYTGSGWTFLDKTTRTIPGAGRTVLQSTIAKGNDRRMVIYWYQERSHVIVSKWRHVSSVLSRALTGRETHSLVASISKSSDTGEEVTLAEGDIEFAEQVIEALAKQIPMKSE